MQQTFKGRKGRKGISAARKCLEDGCWRSLGLSLSWRPKKVTKEVQRGMITAIPRGALIKL